MRKADIDRLNRQTLISLAQGVEGPYAGFVDVEIPGCPAFVMFTNSDCAVVSVIFRERAFEPGSMAIWCESAKTATGIIDIGAYTGIYALAAASMRPDITIHAFEPNPFSLARLRLNRAANRLWNIEERNWAIGAQGGYIKLNWFRKRERTLSSTATLAPLQGMVDQNLEAAVTEIRNLDDPAFCAGLGNRPLIKIDVEGAESVVIHGLSMLLQKRPDIIIESFGAAACREIGEKLAPLGYAAFVIDEATATLQPQPAMAPRDPRARNMNQFLTARPDAFASRVRR